MIEVLLGNSTVEKVLLYINTYKDGYAAGIAKEFNISLNMVQKQLRRLEEGAVLVSQLKGNTRIFGQIVLLDTSLTLSILSGAVVEINPLNNCAADILTSKGPVIIPKLSTEYISNGPTPGPAVVNCMNIVCDIYLKILTINSL